MIIALGLYRFEPGLLMLITPVNNMLLTLLKTCEIQVFYTVNNTFKIMLYFKKL